VLLLLSAGLGEGGRGRGERTLEALGGCDDEPEDVDEADGDGAPSLCEAGGGREETAGDDKVVPDGGGGDDDDDDAALREGEEVGMGGRGCCYGEGELDARAEDVSASAPAAVLNALVASSLRLFQRGDNRWPGCQPLPHVKPTESTAAKCLLTVERGKLRPLRVQNGGESTAPRRRSPFGQRQSRRETTRGAAVGGDRLPLCARGNWPAPGTAQCREAEGTWAGSDWRSIATRGARNARTPNGQEI
jgi:hypothetical protein